RRRIRRRVGAARLADSLYTARDGPNQKGGNNDRFATPMDERSEKLRSRLLANLRVLRLCGIPRGQRIGAVGSQSDQRLWQRPVGHIYLLAELRLRRRADHGSGLQ